jgi:hypothetical protein
MAISRLNLGTTNQVLVKAAAGQTSNLLELQNSSGTVVAGLNQDGVWSGSAEPGLVLLNTTSFSGVSSQSINNVFSATYQNYKIVINAVGTHTNPTTSALEFRLRLAGVDNSANNYDFMQMLRNDGAFVSSMNTGTTSQIAFMGDRRISSVIDIFSPAEAAFTNFVVNQFSKGTANTNGGLLSGIHIVATAFDGFTLLVGSGTMTGTVRIYGYNQ